MQKLTPCLWFDTEGEDAATFYTSVFPNSRIVSTAYYGSAGAPPPGAGMNLGVELGGPPLLAPDGRAGLPVYGGESVPGQLASPGGGRRGRGATPRRRAAAA